MEITRDAIDSYAAEHSTPEAPGLAALAAETEATSESARMMVGPVEGRFLELMVWLGGARRVLEIGMFTGYSALWMAAALPPDGTLVTCEIDPERAAIARRHFDADPAGDRIEIRVGAALDTLETLEGPFDLVFIDADKGNYVNYYEAVLPKLSERGLILADNVLRSCRVLDPKDQTEDTQAIRRFNDHVRRDPRVVCVMLTVRDGVSVIRRA